MKLQFGLLYRDERVVAQQDLATLLAEYACWNAETSGEFFDGPLLMGLHGRQYRPVKVTKRRGEALLWRTSPFTLFPHK
jgi:hypothetical protein